MISKHTGIKILHIITSLSTGGAEWALFNLLHGGLDQHFDSFVISLGNEGTMAPQIRALGVPVTSLNMRGGLPSLSGLAKLRRVVRECEPDLIQGWMYHGNLAAVLARTFAQTHLALIWNIRHSLYSLKLEKLMTRQVIRANRFFSTTPDVVLYNSELSREQHEAFGFSSGKSQVIPNGINVQRFGASSEARKGIRSELGIPAIALVVGHVARLHSMKGHPAFLRVAVDLAHRYPELHFLLIGRDVSIDNNPLAELIPRQMRDRFHLLGERGDVPKLMSAMDIYCQSSKWGEGFPNALGEAMAVGVPCVATDVGDSAIIVGDTGVVVPSGNEEALTTGIETLLIMSLEDRRLLGVRARARIETNYKLEMIVDRYADLYEKLGQI